jgi:hypothetical protein
LVLEEMAVLAETLLAVLVALVLFTLYDLS